MKRTLKNVWKSLSRVNGNSLAEFATVSALMATLAATAAPKLSEMSEGTKAEKSGNEIDKILKQAQSFYQATADTEGRGRFPGQEKFNVQVGSHGAGSQVEVDLNTTLTAQKNTSDAIHNEIKIDLVTGGTNSDGSFKHFEHTDGSDWVSVFYKVSTGGSGADAGYSINTPSGATVGVDTYKKCTTCRDGVDQYENGVKDAAHGLTGADEWLTLFNENALHSKFQDGHFIYAVVPGGGTGDECYPPVLYVADLEDPSAFNNSLEP
jgi:Tfp pilus assembly protein FimT